MECKFCKNTFSNKQNLNAHQRRAKYCLIIQGKKNKMFPCKSCGKEFQTKSNYKRHVKICTSLKTENKYLIIIDDLKMRINNLETENRIFKNKYKLLEEKYHELSITAVKRPTTTMKCDYKELLDSYQRLAELYVMDGKNKVEHLNKKYLKKQSRTKYEGQNVIYILTTPGLKKERRYILAKATNLTNRLSTYNKTDEHEVVFYSSCPNKEKMSLVEGLVFNNLSECRERANRERFILPENEKIDYFSNTIKKCIDFVK